MIDESKVRSMCCIGVYHCKDVPWSVTHNFTLQSPVWLADCLQHPRKTPKFHVTDLRSLQRPSCFITVCLSLQQRNQEKPVLVASVLEILKRAITIDRDVEEFYLINSPLI